MKVLGGGPPCPRRTHRHRLAPPAPGGWGVIGATVEPDGSWDLGVAAGSVLAHRLNVVRLRSRCGGDWRAAFLFERRLQEVWMSHVFEHVADFSPDGRDLRVCAEGAVEIRGPHFPSAFDGRPHAPSRAHPGHFRLLCGCVRLVRQSAEIRKAHSPRATSLGHRSVWYWLLSSGTRHGSGPSFASDDPAPRTALGPLHRFEELRVIRSPQDGLKCGRSM